MEWISVEDRLPEEGQRVLALFVTHFMEVACFKDGEWKVSFDDWSEYLFPISHWMPLPEPPQE